MIVFPVILFSLDINIGIKIAASLAFCVSLVISYRLQEWLIGINSRTGRAILKFLPAIINALLAIIYTQKKEWRWKLIASVRDSALLLQLKNTAVNHRNLEQRMLNVIDTILMQYLTFAIQAIMTLNWKDLGSDLISVGIAIICLYPRIADFARHICNG